MARFTPSKNSIHSIEFSQQYQHVYIQDFETDDTPPPLETGSERYSAGRSSLLVLTRPDTSGDVFIELFYGDPPSDAALELIFNGSIEFNTGVLSIATIGAAEEDTYPLPRAGEWKVAVWVKGGASPWYIGIGLAAD